MARKFKIPILIFLAATFCLLFSHAVYANDWIFNDPEHNKAFDEIGKGITTLLGWVIIRTISFFVAIAVEAFVFRKMLNLSFGRCLLISFTLNFFSTLVGERVGTFSLLSGISFLPFLVAIALFLFIILKWKPPSWFWITALAAILIGAPVTFTQNFEVITGEEMSGLKIVLYSAMLFLLGFGTTLLTESLALIVFFKGVAATWFISKLNIWRVILVANIISYIILIPFFIISPPLRFQLFQK
jgi:hypothetical protein